MAESFPIAGVITSVDDLVKALEASFDRFERQSWWRGQPVDRPLLPKVHRPEFVSRGPAREQRFAVAFEAGARPRYPDCPPSEEFHQWLFLMQHYGLPTRLLDWTRAALVGLYFALGREGEDNRKNDGVLWSLDASRLTQMELALPHAGLALPHAEEAKKLIAGVWKPDGGTSKRCVALVAQEIDPRMMAQLSTFTIHGSTTPLEDHEGAEEFLSKFVIPADAKERLQTPLMLLGIRRRNLFPDLQNLAEDIVNPI